MSLEQPLSDTETEEYVMSRAVLVGFQLTCNIIMIVILLVTGYFAGVRATITGAAAYSNPLVLLTFIVAAIFAVAATRVAYLVGLKNGKESTAATDK